jgi:hypothetical protein
MKTPHGLLLAAALFAALSARPAGSATLTPGVLDSGRFVVFSHGEPVATEDFEYEVRNDTMFVTSRTDRRARANDGTVKPYMKSMEVIARADDWGLLTYLSTEKFDGHKVNRMVFPSDTAVTVAIERDEFGAADKLERLPGRVYVMDAGLFTLFDVIARSVHGRIFGPRPVALVTLGDQNASVHATATPAGRDTIRWGARPVVADLIVLSDSTSTFSLYVSDAGKLLRLENAAADLVVLREAPPVPKAAKRRRPPPPPPR